MDSRTILVSLAVLATATAGPISLGQRKCSTKCTGSEKFKYKPGTTYTYNYDGSVTTKINGAMEEGSGLHMTAVADIEVLDKCNLVLKLRSVRLEDHLKSSISGSSRFGRSLEEKPLHFSFQDGRIEELCTVDEEKWVLNIKRGVLSAFQNSMDDLKTETVTKETDVAGRCDAEYKLGESAWRSFSIIKKKDLLACTDRQAAKTALQSTPYKSDSDIQSLPLTKGTHMCQHDIHNSGYLLKSDCQEVHVFRPFSKESNGATTTASHRLEFVGEAPGVSSRQIRGDYRRTDLLFEHEREPEKNSRDLSAAMDSLKVICEQMKQDVRPSTPRIFSELVYKLKDLDARSLSKLYRYVNNNGVCRDNHQAAKKFFMDAIPMVGSTASVALIGDLVSQRVIQGSEAEMWISSLAFIQQPTQQMMNAVKTLMESVSATKSTYLAGSALVNSYCKDKPSCSRDPTVQRIAATLEGKLNYNCRLRGDRDRDRMMMTLKALGNMGNAPRATQTISRCMMESSNPIDVRLAAIDALRRQPCDTDRARVLTLFSDANEDSEIRIAAYLASMQCATPEVVDAVTSMLKTEKVNQVGSFVWTHLTNLKETSCPFKQELRKILENKYLQKEFDLDARKYSRNFEGSFFSERMNAGANVDGNLIWSQKSFVPRSGMMNITINLFGQSVNLLEFGGRAEGVELLAEKYFGKSGPFADSTVGQMLKRNKRSASDDKINRIDNEFNSKRNNDLKGSMYFRVFGHEVSYFDLASAAGKSDFNILEMLIKLASNHDINYSKSFMFLDTTVTIPTILGMPLKLAINGTATVNIQISGKMDVRQAFTSPRSMDITGSIKPSGAVAISSFMSIDAFVVRTGLKMVTTLHSSSEIDGSIKMENGQAFITKINMPREKQEILNAENKFYIVHGDREVEETMPAAKRITKNKCTGKFLTQLLGIELCGEMSHPAFDAKNTVFAPLMGPSKMSISLNKRDTLTAYEFEARFQNRKDRHNGQTSITHVARLAFNTPGSKIDREMSVDLLMNRGERKLNFNLISPWTKVTLNGEITNTEESKQANLRLILDDKKEYAFLSQLRSLSKNGRTSFSPNIEIRIPKRRPITVSGMLDYMTGRKVDVNLVMENLFTTPITVKGGVEKDVRGSKTRYNTNIDIKSHYLDTKLSGYIDNRPSNYKSRMTVDYRMNDGVRQRMSLNYKIRNVETVSMRKISVDTAVQTTQWPEYNFDLSTDIQKTSRHAESSVSLRYGADDTNPYKRLAAAAIINYDINGDKVKADGSAKLNFPAKNIDFNMKVNHNHDPRGVQTKAIVEYQTGKKVNFEMNLRDFSTRLLKMTGDINLELPNRVLAMSHQIEERQPREYHHNMFLQWQRGQQVQTTSMYKAQGKTHTFTSNIQLPERRPININAATTLDPMNFAGSVQVDYERKVYGLDMGYNFNMGDDNLLVAGRFDAKHPARRVTGSAEVRRAADEYGTKLDVKWDADRDQTQAVAVEGAYKLEHVYRGKHHTGKFLLSYPGRQATVSMDAVNANGKYQSKAEVEWEAGKKMTLATAFALAERTLDASIKFTSPFQYVENVGATLTHRRHSDITTNAEVTWATRKSIKVETTIRPRNAKNFEAIGSISTPFNGYRMMTANARYSLDERSISGALEGTMENKKIGITMSGSLQNGVDGNLKIEIPQMSQPITAKFNHKSGAGIYDTSAEMTWSLKKISALLKVKPVSWHDMEFTLSFNTPFQRFTTMTVQGIHKFDNDGLRTKVFGQYDSKKMGLEVAGKFVRTYSSNNVEGTIHLNSPIQGYEDISVTLKHTDDGHRFSSAADATWDDKKIGAALYMSNTMRGWNIQSSGRLQIVTPFKGYERSFYNWRHNNDFNGITSSHSMTVRGLRYTMSVGGKNQVTRSGRNIEGKLNIQTPHDVARNLNGEVTFTTAPSSFKANVLASRSETDKVELGVEGSYDSRYNFMGSATLDLTALAQLATETMDVRALTTPVKATIKGQMNTMPYTGHIEAMVAKDRFSLDLSASPISWRQFETSASLKTPYAFAKTLGMKATSTITGNELNTIITSQYNENKVEMHIRGSNKGTEEMINLSGNVKIVNPFTSDVSAGMKFIKQAKRVAATIAGSYDTYKTEAGFDAELDMSNGIDTKGNAALVLPIFGEQKMAYAWDLTSDLKTTLNSQNTYSWNDMSFIANAQLTATTGYSKGQVTIKTPLDFARVIKIDMENTIHGNSISSSVRFSRNRSQKGAFTMSLIMDNIYKAEGRGKLTINNMDPISFTIKTDAVQSPYSGHAELSWAQQKKIGVYGAIAKSDNAVDTSITFTSPFSYFEKIGMKVSHKTEGNAKITAATLEYQPDKMITLTTNIDNSKKHTGTITLTTPFDALNKVSLSYEHEISAVGFHHTHSIEYQGMNADIAMSNALNYYGSRYITGSTHFTSPFDYIRNVKVNFVHREERSAYTTTADIELEEGKKIEVHSTLEKSDDPKYTLTVESPYEYLRTMKVEFEHRGQFPYTTTSGKFEMQNRFVRASIAGDVKIQGTDSIAATLRLITPIKYYEHMFMSLNHGKVRGEWRTSLEGQLDMRKRMNIKSTFSMENNPEGSLTVSIPYLGMDKLKVTFEHEGSMTHFILRPKFEMKWQGEKTELEGEVRVNGINDIKITVNGDTPYSGHQTVSVAAQHSTNGPVRTFTATMDTPAGKSEFVKKITTHPNYKVEVEVKTPYNWLQTLNFLMEHTGDDVTSFNNKIDLSYINMLTRVLLTNELAINGMEIAGKFHMTSPIKHFEVINAAYSNKREGNKFTTEADIEYAPRKQILMKSTIDVDKQAIDMSLKTPFQQVRDMQVKLQHEGGYYSPLKNHLFISLNSQKIIKSHVHMSGLSSIQAKTEVNGQVFTMGHKITPGMIDTTMSLRDVAEFILKHEMTMSGSKGKIVVNSRKDWMKSLEANYEHAADHGTDTVAHLGYDGLMGQSRADLTMRINGAEMISGNMHLASPMIDDVEVIVDHKTVRRSTYQSIVNVVKGNNKLVDLKSTIATSPLNIDIALNTPFEFLRTMTMKMNHAGQPTYFTNTADILIATANDRLTIDSDIRVRSINNIEGRMEIKSSFSDNIIATVSHKSRGETKNINAAIEYAPSKKIEIIADYKHEGDLSVQASLRSPCKLMENMNLEFDLSEDLTNARMEIRHNILNEPITFSYEVKADEVMEGKMVFTSGCPAFKNVEITGQLKMVNGESYHTEGTITWMDKKTSFVGDVSVISLNSMSGTVLLKTPFEKYSDIFVSFEHNGDLSAFRTMAAVDVNNNGKSKIVVGWKKQTDMQGTIVVESPLMKTLRVGVTHKNPSYRKYETKMNAAYGSKEYSIESLMTINSLTSFDGAITIKTPCPKHPYIRTSFSHHGSLMNFRNSIAMETASGAIRASSDFSFGDTISANLKIETPWAPLSKVTVGMKHTGGLSKCQTTFIAETDFYGNMEMTSQWSLSPMEAAISLTLPSYEKMSTGFKYKTMGDVHEGEFVAKYGAKTLMYKEKLTFKYFTDFSTEIEIKTPWKFSDITFTHRQSGDVKKYTGDMKLATFTTLSTNVYGDLEFNTVLQTSPLDYTINIKTPWTGIQNVVGKFSHRGNLNAFNTALNVVADGKKMTLISVDWTKEPINAKVVVNTPFHEEIKAMVSFINKTTTFNTDVQFSYGTYASTVASTITVRSPTDVEIEIATTTPFAVARESKLSYMHRGNSMDFSASLGVDNNRASQVNAAAVWTRRGRNIETSLTIRSIFVEPIIFEYKESSELQTNKYNAKTEATLTFGDKVSGIRHELELYGSQRWSNILAVRTPFPEYSSMQLTLNHRGDYKTNLMDNIEFDWSSKGKSTMSLQYEYGTVSSARFVLDTPFFDKVVASGKHDIQGTRTYRTELAGSYGSLAYAFNTDISVSNVKDMSIVADLKTPIQNFDLVFTHKGDQKQFNCNLKLESEGEIITHVTTDFNLKPFNANIQVATAFDGFRTMGATASVNSDAATLILKKERQEIKAIASAVRGDMDVMGVTIETPFAGFEKMHAKLSHGDIWAKTLVVNANVMYMTGKEIDLGIKFRGAGALVVDVTLTTPFKGAEHTQFYLRHTGRRDFSRFDTNVKFTYMKNQEIAYTMKFNTSPKITFNAKLETPFEGAEMSTLIFSHDGSLTNFNTNAKLTYMTNQMIEGNMNFQMGDNIELKATLKTPFAGAEMSEVSFNHGGSLKNFNTIAKVTYMSNKVIEGNMHFTMDSSIDFTATLKTPFTNAEFSQITFSHAGSLQNFNTEAKVTFMNNQVIEGNVQFNMGRRIELTAVLKTPFTGAEYSELKFNHAGSLQNFNTMAKMTYMRDQIIEGNMQWDMGSKIELSAVLKTPFPGAESNHLVFTHDGTLKNLNTNAKLTFKRDQVIEGDVQFNMAHGIGLTATLKTPFTNAEMSKFTFTHEGGLTNFNTNAKVDFMRNKMIEASMSFSTRNNIDMTVTLKTPFEGAEMTQLAFSHVGSLMSFKTNAKLTYMTSQIIEGDIAFSKNSLTATLKTPFSGYEISRLTVAHDGDLNAFRTSATLTAMYREIKFTTSFSKVDKIEFAASWNTPFEYIKDGAIAFGHEGTLDSFKTNAKITYLTNQDIEFNMERAESFVASLKTPFTNAEFTKVEVSHSITDFKNFEAKTKVTYMRNQVIEFNVKFSSDKKHELVAKLMTPFAGAESSELTISHQGGLIHFHTNAKLNYQRNKVIQALVQFNMKDKIAVFAQLRTPFAGAETTEFTMHHHMGDSSFRTEAKLEYMQYKRIDANIDYSLNGNNLEITAQLNTPFKNIRHNVFNLRHNGGLTSFNTNAKLTYAEQEIAAKVNFKNANLRQIEVSAELKTPFKGAEKMSAMYTHNGDSSKFECNAAVEYKDMKPITANLKFQQAPAIDVTATINTPFEYFEAMTMKFNHAGVLNRFKQSGLLSINKKYDWTYKVDLANEGLQTIAFNGEITTPVWFMTKWSVKVNHNSDETIRSNVAFLIEDREYATGKLVFEGHSLKVQFNTPQITMAINHEGAWKRFKSTAALTVYSKKFNTEAAFTAADISGSLSVETPYGTMTLSHDGSYSDFKSKATFNNGNEYETEVEFSLAPMTMMLKMTAPTGSIELNHAGWPKHFTNKMVAVCAVAGTYMIETNFDFDTRMASVKIASPQMNIDADHKTHASGFISKVIAVCKQTGRYAADVTFNKNTMGANLNVNTPYGIAVLTHKGMIEDFETKSTINLNKYGAYNAEVNFNLREVSFQAIVTTPYGNGKISHHGMYKPSVTSMITATIMGKEYSLEYKANVESNTWTSTTILKTPFYSWTGTWAGSLTNFKYNTLGEYQGKKTVMEIMFNMEKKIAGSFIYRSPIKYLEHIALSFSHSGDLRYFETDGSVSWTTADTITAHVDFRRSRRFIVVNTKLETPFTERFAMNARHQGQLAEFRSSITADYGSKRTQAVVQYNRDSATISLMTPFERFESLSASYKKSRNNGYHAEISWAPRKKIMADITYAIDGTYSAAAASGVFTITTPFSAVESLSVEFENRHSIYTYLKNVMKIELNSKATWNTKTEIRIAADRVNIQATMTIPHPTTVSVKMFKSEKEKTADIDVNVNGMRVYLNAFHKDESSYYRVKRDSSIKLIVPARTMALTSSFDSSRYQSNHKVEVTLDQERGKKVTYEGTFADRSRSYQKNYEGTVKLTTPLRTLKTTVTHTQTSNNFNTKTILMWDADRNTDRKMEIDTVYEKNGKKHNVAVTLEHPRLNKPISLRGEITLNKENFLYAGKTELQYSADPSEKLTLSGKVNDESYGRRQNYSMSMKLSHPKSLINVDMTSHIGNTDSKMSAGVEMNYLTARRSQENVMLRGEIDKLRKSITMKLRTPMTNIAIDGGMKHRHGVINMHLTNTMDSTPYRHFLEINTKMPSFSLKTTYAPGKMYSLSGTANATTAKIESSRINGKRITTDGLASANLNGSKVIFTRLHWNPALADQVEEYAKETYATAKTTITTAWDDLVSALTEEWTQHSNIVSNAMPNVAAAASYISDEADSFKVDAERIKNEWNNMYYRNEFFMRNIDEYMTATIDYIKEKATLLQFQIRRYAAEISRHYQAKMAMYRRAWDEKMGKLEETIAAIVLKFRPAWQSYAYAVIRSYQESNQKIRHRFEEAMENMDEYRAAAVNYLDDKFDFITYKMEPYFAKFGTVQESLRYYLLSDKQKTYFDVAKERIVSFFDNLREEYQEWKSVASQRTQEMILETKAQISQNLDQILGHEYSKMVVDMAQQAVVDMKKAYSEYEIETRLKELLKGAYYKLDDYARKQVKTLVKTYMRIGESGFTVFEPEHGRIEAKIFLPLEIKSLDQLPDLKLAEMKQEMEKLYTKYKPSSEFSIWDTYYKYKPTSDIMNWIPPFKAHATLAHGKHFTTFDGTTFEFAGTCSYLLARDFGDANFTVIANYKEGMIESHTIYSNGQKIEIFSDFKLMVNDARTEMPYEYKNTTISRDEITIKVINAKGFVFTFDTAKDIVTLDISGWYFSKTAGLFGTYDNEPSNDFTMPNHKIAKDVQAFSLAWEVAPYCRASRNLARTVKTTPGSQVDTTCTKFFKSGKSILRPCFSVVPVEAYYERCVSDLEQDFSNKRTEDKACKAIQTYVAECKKAEVELKAPESCATCTGPSGDLMMPSDEVTFNTSTIPSTKSADIIFVVEEKQCNKEVANKLPALASKIEKSLKLKGMKNNRFGVVAFGGHGVHNKPHAHTMEDQIFNDARKMNLIQLDFHEDGSNTDVLEAISFAAKYNFRAGVSKSIVVIPCSACQDKAISSTELYEQLAAQDIVLHLMQEYDFQLKSRSPKSNYIFGIDSNSAYTSKDVIEQTLRGDTALLRQVVVPKDTCVALAHKTRGSFFSAQKMTTGRYSAQKAFLDVMGRRVALGATVIQGQDCKCVVGENGMGRTICKATPLDLVKLTPAKTHLLGHMGENPEVGPLATPPTMEFEEVPLSRRGTSVRIVGQGRPVSYRARQ